MGTHNYNSEWWGCTSSCMCLTYIFLDPRLYYIVLILRRSTRVLILQESGLWSPNYKNNQLIRNTLEVGCIHLVEEALRSIFPYHLSGMCQLLHLH